MTNDQAPMTNEDYSARMALVIGIWSLGFSRTNFHKLASCCKLRPRRRIRRSSTMALPNYGQGDYDKDGRRTGYGLTRDERLDLFDTTGRRQSTIIRRDRRGDDRRL